MQVCMSMMSVTLVTEEKMCCYCFIALKVLLHPLEIKASAKDIGRRKFSHSTIAQPHIIFGRTQLTRMAAHTTIATTCTRITEPTTVTTASSTKVPD